MRTLILTCLVLTVALGCFAGTAAAQPPVPVGTCNAVTHPCWNGSLFCVGISLQVPFCLPIGLT